MTLDTKHFIGEGANWKIYRTEEKLNTIIVRIPKMELWDNVNNYVNKYKIVKSSGLPTLDRVEKGYYNETEVVITEDLNNSQKRIYVSPNSVVADQHKQVNQIQRILFPGTKEIHDTPDAERYRLEHKLNEIIGFDVFLKIAVNNIRTASDHDIFIPYDAYFFGSEMDSFNSILDYKIVDFDGIETKTGKKTNKLYQINIIDFIDAVSSFVRHFVNDGEQKDNYFKAIESYK